MTWVLHVDADLDEANRHWRALTAAGMLGAAEVDGRAQLYFPRHVADLGLPGRWERLAGHDWNERWRAGLTPVTAGRWTVTPSWLATGAAGELLIDPGQAFGTGHHETTLGCLEALDRVPLNGRTLLDVGTGTGILAIAAATGGAMVTAVDVDALAVDAAHANARRNGVAIALIRGGPDATAGDTFDVVVANLDSATIRRLADRLAAALAPDGLLIAGGISNEHADEVARALRGVGLDVTSEPGREWSLLHGRARS